MVVLLTGSVGVQLLALKGPCFLAFRSVGVWLMSMLPSYSSLTSKTLCGLQN